MTGAKWEKSRRFYPVIARHCVPLHSRLLFLRVYPI